MSDITLLRVVLRIEGRWGVGAPDNASDEVGQPVRVTMDGIADIPGSGLAGSLRRHLGSDAEFWLGPPPPEAEQRKKVVREASRLGFVGIAPSSRPVVTRGATAIDARRRAADVHTLRHEQYAEPTDVVVALEHEQGLSANDALVDQLLSWTPVIGRARSSGMGAAWVPSVEWMRPNLDDAGQLTWWLTKRSSWLRGEKEALQVPAAIESGSRRQERRPPNKAAPLAIQFTVVEPIRIGVGKGDGEGGKRETKLQATFTSRGALTVPGSSWKGVFRSRVERILEAVAGSPQGDIVAVLFGSADRRGFLGFSDTCGPHTSRMRSRTHVAIDRITGGAKDSALFKLGSIPEDATLTLLVSPTFDRPIPPSVEALLMHVVRDLGDGLAGIGGHSTRGYGWVRASDGTTSKELPGVDLAVLRSELGLSEGKGAS